MEHQERAVDGLIHRAQAGDRGAQEALWGANRRWVAAIILAHRPRSIEVDDLMQDVAVKFVSKIGTLRDPGAFRPWLRQIVINVCRGAARQLKPTMRLPGPESGADGEEGAGLQPVSQTEADASDVVASRDSAGRLYQQAMTLPPEYREPLLLRCLRSMSYQQISELLELPVTTIETRLARARRMLRDEIGEDVYGTATT